MREFRGGHHGSVKSVCVRDANIFASGARDGAICVWDVRVPRPLLLLADAHVPPTRAAASKRRRTSISSGTSQKTVSSLLFIHRLPPHPIASHHVPSPSMHLRSRHCSSSRTIPPNWSPLAPPTEPSRWATLVLPDPRPPPHPLTLTLAPTLIASLILAPTSPCTSRFGTRECCSRRAPPSRPPPPRAPPRRAPARQLPTRYHRISMLTSPTSPTYGRHSFELRHLNCRLVG